MKLSRKPWKQTEFPVFSEEGTHTPYSERSRWTRFWLVDPLDGTKEFIKRNGEFTVNIALVEEGRSRFGVVYAPVIKELYVGIPGRGAFLCTRRERISIRPWITCCSLPINYPWKIRTRSCSGWWPVVPITTRKPGLCEALDTGGREISLVSKGSSLKLCMVAAGEADIYPRLGPTMEWDTAQPMQWLRPPERMSTGPITGRSLCYNKENLLNPYFVVK